MKRMRVSCERTCSRLGMGPFSRWKPYMAVPMMTFEQHRGGHRGSVSHLHGSHVGAGRVEVEASEADQWQGGLESHDESLILVCRARALSIVLVGWGVARSMKQVVVWMRRR